LTGQAVAEAVFSASLPKGW